MHINVKSRKRLKFMENFRLLRYLIYRLSIVCYRTPVNSKAISQIEIKYQQIKDFSVDFLFCCIDINPIVISLSRTC